MWHIKVRSHCTLLFYILIKLPVLVVERCVFYRLIVDLIFILVQNFRKPGFQNTNPGCKNTNTMLLTSPSPSCTGTHLKILVVNFQPIMPKSENRIFNAIYPYQTSLDVATNHDGHQVFPRVSSSCFAPRKLTVPRPCKSESTF